ncbi:MAG: Ig-like domain-containing protein, partial [Clostridium sp.]|nr:Ig-like domain-containing protein [Clostridium sp.]
VDATGGAGNNSGEYAGDPVGNGGNANGEAGVTKTAGIIFENGEGKVHGTVALNENYAVPAGYTLTFADEGRFDGNYAFYQNGSPVEMAVVKESGLTGPATVQECTDHVWEYAHVDDTEQHSKTCRACGYSVTEDCTYDEDDAESNEDDTHTLTCVCGSAKTEDCSGGTATYTEKAVCELCKHGYGELLKDSGAPTGEISIRTSKWNSFLNTVTVGLFFKDTEKVTITAEDQESGVKSVAYYISDKGMSEEEVKALEAGWKNVNGNTVAFNISEDKLCVVYAKITDRQGNVTYLSSDGMVFDGTAPAIIGVENDKAYCGQQTVEVRDDNLESVTVNGKEVTLSDNKFILEAESGLQMIEAKDKAGNAVTVTVNMGHRYGTGWKSNETQHWHECSNCNARSDIAVHTKDSGTVTKAPTVTEKGTRTYLCSVCGYEMGEEAIDELSSSHTHEFGTDWKKDVENHWHECSGCGAKSDSAAHTKDSGTVTKEPTETEAGIRIYCCSVCGYKMDEEVIDPLLSSHTHNYSTEWTLDSRRHWHECICGSRSDSAAHTKDSGTVTKAPTVTEKGIRTYHCSVCGYEMGEEVIDELPPSHTHEFSTDWKTDSSRHWHECICGEKSDSVAHTKDGGTVTKAPTETETGIRTYYCSVCGYKMDEEVIDKLPPSHTHSFRWVETKAATCTETGIRTYTCACGDSYTETIAALGHDFDGTTNKCKVCGCLEVTSPEPTPGTTEKPEPSPTGGVTKEEMEKNSADLNGTQTAVRTGKKLTLTWGRIRGADGYYVYVQYCGKKFTSKSRIDVKGGKTTKLAVTKIGGKKLNGKKNIKFYVAAYKKSGKKKEIIGKTFTFYMVSRSHPKYTDVKKIKVKKSRYSLKKGQTAQIKASVSLTNPKKKELGSSNAKRLRYISSNKKVATVSGNGKICARRAGTCTIYVIAANGKRKKIKVTVKK